MDFRGRAILDAALLIRLTCVLACVGLHPWARAQINLPDYGTNHPLRVMAMGDSITDDCSYNGAWRQFLQPLLQSNGYSFTFVGRQTSTRVGKFTETHHEGYCGSVIAPPGMMSSSVHGYVGTDVYLQKIAADALAAITPDLVLVVMGANDIGRGRNPYEVATNDMPHLLDLIFSNAPAASVVLTKTTTLRDSALGYATNASNVPIYNAALQAMVQERAAAGQNISLADMFSVVDYGTMFNSDHLHPNLTGLNAMAREFLTRIKLISIGSDSISSTLVPGGAVWRYSDTGQDLGTNWTQPDYDDSGWNSGLARLGYGDKVAATTITYGTDPKQKHPTTYFRHSFLVLEGIAITNLNFRLAVQDGAVVWLNGHEAFRTNLPAGPVGYTNLALKRVVVDAPYIFYPRNVDPGLLHPGTNTLAVEVHLNSPIMPSLGFDLGLLATGAALRGPVLSAAAAGGSVSLSWPAVYGGAYEVYSSVTPAKASTWNPVPATVQTNGNQCVVTVRPDNNPCFFRVQRAATP